MAFPSPETIDDFSDRYIALKFELGDGVRFGFARIDGLRLTEFAYETEAGVGIQTRSGPYAPLPGVAPIPLPAGLPLLGTVMLGALFLSLRRKRAA